ncbi:MAG: enoyl-CoA hydratase/isomerase family protein [Chelatococcus sp.]|uniref:enoyl-CoA hydratase/isomerase family protein n=1 Tax=unclassified Chelatococcus TaxID=2638111 RepID=UPI001BCCD685|nr:MULTISPECIES: enoyl-CoA hydratase/isomerase family protein [unclassified Chelatococcus]CAH1653013.1 Short chain enoyl-CoA hydratase [Hyphomicrobiales bacterium]MBS7742957.1 enoyl-CoA hydratase/isomerase family protein [Chelatococcus sp. HY11]MBX3539370.1 enoyl-CoA hydratase/isomerase family protein [Chelatococcus sp.]MBX3541925.1 enoyl-CoA hydratase/isomerase family protein [Chelatococcus sp.]MCO5074184.1 enoyl-CoA hydratase/isomerase family protein [Chelatococcus sp.]
MTDRPATAEDDTPLTVAHDGPVAVVTIARPHKLNTMTRRFYANITATLRGLEQDGGVRVVVITGAGERAFSAGGDIGSLDSLGDMVDRRAYQREAMAAFLAVERCPLPIIAAVNGLALGGGCELTLACDIVIAAEHAEFGMPEAALGLVPGYGVIRAADKIGRAMTKLLIATRRRIDSATALRIGLVEEVVPSAALLSHALAMAREIAESSPLALEIAKRIIDRNLTQADLDYSTEALAVLQASPDVREGTAAFLGKRKPLFADRRG